MHISKLNVTIDLGELLAFLAPAVNHRLAVHQSLQLVGCMLGLAHVRGEGEDCSGRLCTENDRGEADEELEERVLVATDECSTVPESESDAEEHEGLRHGVEEG